MKHLARLIKVTGKIPDSMAHDTRPFHLLVADVRHKYTNFEILCRIHHPKPKELEVLRSEARRLAMEMLSEWAFQHGVKLQ